MNERTDNTDAILIASRWREWWPSLHTWLPFCVVLIPCYGLGGMLLLLPVYFDPKMQKEWHVDSFTMAAPTSGLWTTWSIGALFWAWVADRHGRKIATIASGWLTIALAAAAAASWNFVSFAVIRSLLGLAMGGQAACSYLLTLEWALQV